MKKIVLKITGMHCTSCAMSIDGELEDTEGVTEARTNYAKQATEVTFNPQKITPDRMITLIRSIDEKYDAKVIKEEK